MEATPSMPRKRQARRCSARRTRDGKWCRNFAMVGGRVCHAHGGRARQVRAKAAQRREMEGIEAAMLRAEARHRRLMLDWMTRRVVYAARVLDRDPSAVIAEFADRGYIVAMVNKWPVGLRTQDSPAFPRLDGRIRGLRPLPRPASCETDRPNGL